MPLERVLEDSSGFELLAASLRADVGDIRGFTEVLASKFEGALPSQTRIERKGGMLSREKRVARITVDLGDQRYQLDVDHGRLAPRICRVVRGIVLKTEEVPLDRWIDDLSQRLGQEAVHSEQARLALERLLDV
jgi:hypothetical protein